MITAIVFINAEVARIPEVAEAIAGLDGVSEVYSVTGQIDLIAMVRVRQHEEVAVVVADQVNKVPGVTRDRDPHRLPDLLLARPRGGVLPRSGLTAGSPVPRRRAGFRRYPRATGEPAEETRCAGVR